MQDTYTINVAGLERVLPLRTIAPGVKIAFFQLLGDTELCETIAKQFANMIDDVCDYIVTPEFKGLPLAHELSRAVQRPYIVVRKSHKPYMSSPLSQTTRSFTSRTQTLWLDSMDADRLRGHSVWLVDDVMTTGNTLAAAEALVERAGGRVINRLAVLKEGNDTVQRDDVVSLGELPVFTSNQQEDAIYRSKIATFGHRALELRDEWPVVYTALSKKTFCYRVLISRFVLQNERVPLNPAMNFDFAFFGLVPKDHVITANNNIIRVADELWVFGPISDGAYAEVLIAKELGRPVRYFAIDVSQKIIELDEAECEYEPDVNVIHQTSAVG